MNSAIEPWSRAEFERRLIAAAESCPIEETRFYRALQSGRCPRSVLRTYALATVRSAELFCSSLAMLIDQAPDREARSILLENLIEEEGIVLKPSRGLIVRRDQSHPALARRFLVACWGGNRSDAEIESARHATSPGREMLAQGRWLEALAFLLVGQEYKFSQVCRKLVPALRRYGFSERDLAFFSVHVEADEEHGRQAIALVLNRADTAQRQSAALAAAEAGARHWSDHHGGAAPERRTALAA